MSNFNETSFGFFIFLLRTAHQHYSPTEFSTEPVWLLRGYVSFWRSGETIMIR
jgi:hypothetical protein